MNFNSIKVLLIVLFSYTLPSCGSEKKIKKNTIHSKSIVKIYGSDSVFPLLKSEKEHFNLKNESITIDLKGGGSQIGIQKLIEGKTDIAMSSRTISSAEKEKLKKNNLTIKSSVIAYDAIMVIVHPDNPISKITRENLEKIYTGKIKNWKELGGSDLEIVPYSREKTSGTYEYFKEKILNGNNYSTNLKTTHVTSAIVQSVERKLGGIGYISLAYRSIYIKPLALSFDKGKNYINPNLENTKNKIYPLSRPLYLLYNSSIKEEKSKLIKFTLSAKGQEIVSEIGYINVN